MQERLWVILLPALILFALVGATWPCLQLRQSDETRRLEELEQRMKVAVRAMGPEVGRAVETQSLPHVNELLQALAHSTGGRVDLHGERGVLLATAMPSTRSEEELPGPGGVLRGDVQEILVWGPATGVDGAKVAELRLRMPAPREVPFPWAMWSSLLAVFGLISAAVLWLVTRVLSPLGKLAIVFRELGRRNPDEVEVPGDRLAEFGQLRNAIVDCVDSMQRRQLAAEESFVELAFSLAREYEYHREGRIGHSQRTRRYAAWVAERLGMSPKDRDTLEVAALCHDIGKMPTDESQCWGAEEIERVHAVLGAAFFDAMPGLEDVARIVLSHHENFDGSGMPDGLKGEEIPLGARILRIADSFERLYSGEGPDLGVQETLAEMEEGKGREFDPEIFELFREEVTMHLLEQRRLKVTLRAFAGERGITEGVIG